jgi:hypothetical protein
MNCMCIAAASLPRARGESPTLPAGQGYPGKNRDSQQILGTIEHLALTKFRDPEMFARFLTQEFDRVSPRPACGERSDCMAMRSIASAIRVRGHFSTGGATDRMSWVPESWIPRCFLGRPLTRSPRVTRANHSRSFASAFFSKNGRRRRPMLSPRAGRGKKEAAPRGNFPGTALRLRGRGSVLPLSGRHSHDGSDARAVCKKVDLGCLLPAAAQTTEFSSLACPTGLSESAKAAGWSGGEIRSEGRSRSANCSGTTGLLNRKPCISSQA